MPLIDVTLKPGFTLTSKDGLIRHTRHFIRKVFGPELPGLFVKNSELFGMDTNTPEDGVQVQFHDYDEDDINVADIWIKVQFSEEQRDRSTRLDIRNEVFDVIVDQLKAHGFQRPDNIVLDVFWGPTHGYGCVNGTVIEW